MKDEAIEQELNNGRHGNRHKRSGNAYASAMAWVLLVIVAIATALTFKSSQYWVFYEDQGREKR